MQRVIFVGDLHGCYDEAVALLAKCQVTTEDRVIFLGDLIDRGPENAKCCDLVRQREQTQGSVACVLGNHEEKHLQYEDIIARGKKLDTANMPATHVAARAQLKPEHYVWFRQMPLFIRVPEYGAAAVHAGCFPGRPLEAQEARHLLHIQMLNKNGDKKTIWPSRVPDNEKDAWVFWTHLWNGPEQIVFGHSVLDRPLITDKVAGIDGGAVFGRQLHAYVLPERRIVSLTARDDYGKGRRGTQSGNIKVYPIHGDVSTYS